MTIEADSTFRPQPANRWYYREWLGAITLFALLAFAIRGWTFGNPIIHVDDQYYLLGGQRLLRGDLPYVQFWDRKPVGIFLIYALPNLLSDPVIAYQIMATLAAVATAMLVYTMARRLTGAWPALAGGASYLAWLPLFGGMGGQTPVFYNLPMAAAAALTLVAVAKPDERKMTRRGMLPMLLVGCAIQIKYTALFEGIFFGVSLLWCGWTLGRRTARLALDGLLWVTCAIGPTLAAWGYYAANGRAMLFAHANFISVFFDEKPFGWALIRLGVELFGLLPFWFGYAVAWRRWCVTDSGLRGQALWLLSWAASSVAGYLVFGTWFDHYVLPLLPPLCVVAALAIEKMARSRLAMALLFGIGLGSGIGRALSDESEIGTPAEAARLSALVERSMGKGDVFVTQDMSTLYFQTGSPLPSQYAFPEHLMLKRYAHSLGVSQVAELGKVFSREPSVVVFLNDPDSDYLPASMTLVRNELARKYRLAGTVQVGSNAYQVYARMHGPLFGATSTLSHSRANTYNIGATSQELVTFPAN